jgi:hypothetical protein
MLTDKYLLLEIDNSNIGGAQRIYRFPSGCGLSVINSPRAHVFPYAWEVAILKNVSKDGSEFELTYDTELTNDVAVFMTDEETNEFIEKAIKLLANKKELQ